MEKYEVRQQTDEVKSQLERVLADYQDSFVARTDIKALQEMIKDAEGHFESECRAYNCYEIDVDRGLVSGELKMRPYQFDTELFNKIVDHASQYKRTGIVRYKVGNEYLETDEMKEKLKHLICGLNGRDDVLSNSLGLMKSFLSQLDRSFNLSAKQIRIVEFVLRETEKSALETI